MKTICITRADGGVSLLRTDGSVDDEIAKLATVTKIVSWREIDPSEKPLDRTFRDAWKDTGKIDVDMVKARDIQRDRIRAKRKPKLEALDIEYMKAHEKADVLAMNRIVAQKQALRDAPAHPDIEAAQTPEALKNVWPAGLDK